MLHDVKRWTQEAAVGGMVLNLVWQVDKSHCTLGFELGLGLWLGLGLAHSGAVSCLAYILVLSPCVLFDFSYNLSLLSP